MNEPVFAHWISGMVAIAGGALSVLLGSRHAKPNREKKAADKRRPSVYDHILLWGGFLLMAYGVTQFFGI